MMQGTVDFGTAAGLRSRLGLAEMGGKTGTTNDNADTWFMGYTPQLLAGALGRLRATATLFSWKANPPMVRTIARSAHLGEFFPDPALADKSLGINKDARFPKPDSINAALQYDYNKQYEKAPPPGAEGVDQGNGNAGEYIDSNKVKPSRKCGNDPY